MNRIAPPQEAIRHFFKLYRENLREELLRSLRKDYSLRLFLLASTALTPAQGFAHG